jgi:LCP family protein required for cell wall assembly
MEGPGRGAPPEGGSPGPAPEGPPPGGAPPGAPPPAGRPPGPPEYTVYRSRGWLSRLRPSTERLRWPRRERGPRERRKVTPRRVLGIVLLVAAAWLLLSVVLFLVSAQTTRGFPESTEKALSDEGNLLTGSTILVLGSDERPPKVREALAESGNDPGKGGRADTILLFHVGFGTVRRLSILRDSYAEIPGQGGQKINAAYFLGGPPLMIETVESFMGNGLQIDHIIEVNLERFPELIDALGGVDVTAENKICAPPFDFGGGDGFDLAAGEHHLDGLEALAFARVRTNPCAPEEDDSDRAARQQEVFAGIRSQALSPLTFFRLPWVSWEAPRAIKSDLRGPGLAALFADLLTGGAGGETNVLESSGAGPVEGSLLISEEDKAQAVDELLGRD